MKPILLAAFMTFAAFGNATVARGDDEPSPRLDLYGDPLPAGAIARLGTIQPREGETHSDRAHSKSICDVAATSRGEIVTCSSDSSIRVWDAESGRHRLALWHDKDDCNLAVSPDGLWLASSSYDDTVRLWSLETGREVFRLPGHGRVGIQLRPLAFTADGKSLVSFGGDLYLRVFDTTNGKAIREYSIRPEGFHIPEAKDGLIESENFHLDRSALSPDGKLLALAILGEPLTYDVFSGRETDRFESSGAMVRMLAIAPDNNRLLISSWTRPDSPNRDTTIAVWDLTENGIVVQKAVSEDESKVVAFAPSGECFAAAIYRPAYRLVVFDAETGAERYSFDDLPCGIHSLCYSHDGKRLISGMADSTALVWELK